MNINSISQDTQVILLLCANFGLPVSASISPLSTREFASVSKWLGKTSLSPKVFFEKQYVDACCNEIHLDPKRFHSLLNRGGILALSLEKWSTIGIWIISKTDNAYPRKWIDHLDSQAPPLLYGIGNAEILSKRGVAVVGSRDVNESGTIATRKIARLCTENNIQIISGGARGVDSESMLTALEKGGYVTGILADSLLKAAVQTKYRSGLRENRLVLVSTFDPKETFSVGKAMARNKLVYCLSDWAFVISSSYNKGGTWAGATENLKYGWVPMFVRKDNDVPEGNYQLINKGANSFSSDYLSNSTTFMSLLHKYLMIPDNAIEVCDLSMTYELSENQKIPEEITSILEEPSEQHKMGLEEKISSEKTPDINNIDLFSLVWPHIETQLAAPRTDAELSKIFTVRLIQMKDWLKIAVEKGFAIKLSKPVRYIKRSNTITQFLIDPDKKE